ncbi:hypothetical protein FLK61_40085 [Paenalkalicoccus suaedae]|uniref:Uncharacterized protein n=1 Tax=Paenalkalicoccus suaedae TaxID=2592382 RepID=A0A859FJ31_9BACI|nr:hypothetical protein [Paenalkalicoccus suaedae]QKS72812.1 hypothetical protein FLK61_40085 [Paenalkalicoccus suaedae]
MNFPFDKLKRSPDLVAVPLIIDLFLFFVLISIFSSSYSVGYPFQFAVTIQPVTPSLVGLYGNIGEALAQFGNLILIGVFLIFSLVSKAFVNAGYVYLLDETVRREGANRSSTAVFAEGVKRYFLPMIGVEAVFVLILIGGAIAGGMLGIVVVVIFFAIRILLVFWEFTVVLDDEDTLSSGKRARQYLRESTSEVHAAIMQVIVVHLIFITATFWIPAAIDWIGAFNLTIFSIPLIILAYAVFASASQLNLYEKLVKVRG